jgi:hypothetical protein
MSALLPTDMAEANRLISALDEGNCRLARFIAVLPVQGHPQRLYCICSSIAAAIPEPAGEASPYEASAASFVESNVVYKLASFLGGTLRAFGERMFGSADAPFFSTNPLEVTWRLALVFLKDLVADCPGALQRSLLKQLSDAGKICFTHQALNAQGIQCSVPGKKCWFPSL